MRIPFFFILAFLCTGIYSQSKGDLLIAGGALDPKNHHVYAKFSEGSDQKNGFIGIISTASGMPVESATRFRNNLAIYGVDTGRVVIIPLAVKNDPSTSGIDESTWSENANNKDVAQMIRDCSALWFTGGDQLRTVKVLFDEGEPTESLKAIYEIYKNGALIGGTSAGAAIMSDVMIASGYSIDALHFGSVADVSRNTDVALNLTKGLGLFGYGIIDQHFDQRGRLGRLIRALAENSATENLAFGIDENTALYVNHTEKYFEILGEGTVTMLDISDATIKTGENFYAEKINVSILAHGDRYHPENKTFTINEKKNNLKGKEYYDVENPVALGFLSGYNTPVDFMSKALMDNSEADTATAYLLSEEQFGYKLTFSKSEATKGYYGHIDGGHNWSALQINLDIKPISFTITETE